ncbi:hypothetical protein CQ020_06175 [Arthrobacter sp. MYb23]|uniref:hypothetical protein n=1 Tax=unclassified Arthrobacter TaxID=235627 RepID=UPI000CFA8875|nr:MULTISPECIES: hypothetical protein [unclassified Arthrobacter]PRB43077.1 hypothetical protein CQ038_08805 [Arthrobacter sp. MYb51]PRB98029.1 hypothetical protein CQ020_06175 [Arthrobacter sp. MYb23]
MHSPSSPPDAETVGGQVSAPPTDCAQSWQDLGPGIPVTLMHPTLPTITGTVDTTTEDRSIVWVFSVPHGRVLIHAEDGYSLAAAD